MSRFQFVADNSTTDADRGRPGWTVKRLCALLEVERSSYYAWLAAAPARAARTARDDALAQRIRQAHAEGLGVREAIVRGCEIRFRPIIVSGIVAVIGFLPAAISTGIGSEIQKPLARVVVGGLVSSTLLTLLVLPAIFTVLSVRPHRDGPPPAARAPLPPA